MNNNMLFYYWHEPNHKWTVVLSLRSNPYNLKIRKKEIESHFKINLLRPKVFTTYRQRGITNE